jgi:hypothetical protein
MEEERNVDSNFKEFPYIERGKRATNSIYNSP